MARDTAIGVSILAKYPTTPKADSFLEYAIAVFEKAGFSLVHRVVASSGG